MTAQTNRFLIIAGQPKAGTTSLFRWLAQHEDICASTFKETRFFLDRDYPLPRNITSDAIADYLASFPDRSRPVLLEATPDYLYNERFLSAGGELGDCHIVVVTRDPVERMQSAWSYFRQRGVIDRDTTFADFVNAQARRVDAHTPLENRALDQCRDAYLERAREVYGERLLVIDFAELRRDPAATCRAILSFCGLTTHSVETFEFAVENQTKEVKNAAASRAFFAARRLAVSIAGPRLKALLRPVSKAAQRGLHGQAAQKGDVPEEIRQIILAHQHSTETRTGHRQAEPIQHDPKQAMS